MIIKPIKFHRDFCINEIYTVYGIHVYENKISYLLVTGADWQPMWYYAELFEIIDNLFPIEWYFNFWGYESQVSAIWGFKELVNKDNFHDDLLEREPYAIEIFLKRKKEIDEYHEFEKIK